MGRNFVFGCVLVFFVSTQNQVPQIIIGRVIYLIKTHLVVIGTIFKSLANFFVVSRKTHLKFLHFGLNSKYRGELAGLQ